MFSSFSNDFCLRLPVPVQTAKLNKEPWWNFNQMLSKGFSANLVLLTWVLTGGLLLQGFLANFRAMLLLPAMSKPFDTAEEILDNGMIPIILPGGTFWQDLLDNSPNPIYQKLGERSVMPKDWDELRLMAEEKIVGANTHAWITSDLIGGMYYKDYHPSKEVVEGADPWYVWIVNKKWPLKDQLAKHILLFQQV